ncbi:MAG: hypothetical protein ACI9HB_000749 [Gammaproteobacteria bacterium]|jgi:uncharacterized protein (TIGR00255 family)
MIHSMTAFASQTGTRGTTSWIWEMRGVNARGLDVRVRIPDGLDGVEVAARAALKKHLHRGNVTLNLRLSRADGVAPMTLDPTQLDAVLKALDAVQERAFDMGVTLAQPNAADVLAQRGVMVQGRVDDDNADLVVVLIAQIEPLMIDFMAMRQAEGAALQRVICDQLNQIDVLVSQAAEAAEARKQFVAEQLATAMQRVLQNVANVDPDLIARELAILAVKSDITEEIDRLVAHIAAARALLDDPKPAGRKLDFLTQEFNREANTLCSKAGATALTAIGLELKAVIDQMREQIQNVE